MRFKASLLVLVLGLASQPLQAQTRFDSVAGPGPMLIGPNANPAFNRGGTYYPGFVPYNPYAPNTYSPYGYNNPYVPYGGYGIPTAQPNGLFQFRVGNVGLNMWRSPSGYYYPWAGLPQGYGYNQTTILYAPQATTAPQPQQPPISTLVKDMLTYLDEAKDKKKISDSDYQHLKRRVTDLQSRTSVLMNQAGGVLDPQDETSIRNDLNSVGSEITTRSNR